MVVTVSGTTLQLLDDSNLQAVAATGEEKTSAARTTSGRPGTMDGWMGGGAWVSQKCLHCHKIWCTSYSKGRVGYAFHGQIGRSASLFAVELEAL